MLFTLLPLLAFAPFFFLSGVCGGFGMLVVLNELCEAAGNSGEHASNLARTQANVFVSSN